MIFLKTTPDQNNPLWNSALRTKRSPKRSCTMIRRRDHFWFARIKSCELVRKNFLSFRSLCNDNKMSRQSNLHFQYFVVMAFRKNNSRFGQFSSLSPRPTTSKMQAFSILLSSCNLWIYVVFKGYLRELGPSPTCVHTNWFARIRCSLFARICLSHAHFRWCKCGYKSDGRATDVQYPRRPSTIYWRLF